MNGTIPVSPDDLAQMRRQMRADEEWAGLMLDELWFRITNLEAILAARWPRSMFVRRRLAKRIRASVAEIEGDGFAMKRLNTLGTDWRDFEAQWRTGPKWDATQ